MKAGYVTAAIAAVSMAAIGFAHAAHPEENDALAIATAKIGLIQAIAAAEQHVGGKASRAEYERGKNQWMFDVEVVRGAKVMDVKVDATTGKIVTAAEDDIDRDDEHDEAD